MKVAKETERMNVVLNTDTNEILVTQDWYFSFIIHPRLPVIAPELQTHFKSEVQALIRRLWDNKACLELVNTTNPRFLPYVGAIFNIRVCIREVSMENAAQWIVKVVNIPGMRASDGFVTWETRTIGLNLDTIKNREGTTRGGIKSRQYTAAHEFGHAFGNSSALLSIGMGADEHHEDCPHFSDIDSIMNIGNSVRKRHYEYVRYILEELVMPGTVFKTELK